MKDLAERMGKSEAPEKDERSSSDGRGEIPVFDVREALKNTDGNVEWLRKLLAIMERDLPRQLAGFAEALSLGDFEAMERYAHTIKSQAALAGGISLRRAALDAERAAHEGRLEDARAAATTLQVMAGDMCAEFRRVDWYAIKDIARHKFSDEGGM